MKKVTVETLHCGEKNFLNNYSVVVHIAGGMHKRAFGTFEEALDFIHWSRTLDPISITMYYNRYQNYYTAEQ